MERREKIEQEVRKTMDCLDQGEPLKADAYFYTRLRARINSRKNHGRISRVLFPAWHILAPVLIMALIALNIYTAAAVLTKNTTESSGSDEFMTLLTEDFTLDSNQYNPAWIPNQQE